MLLLGHFGHGPVVEEGIKVVHRRSRPAVMKHGVGGNVFAEVGLEDVHTLAQERTVSLPSVENRALRTGVPPLSRGPV